MKDSGAGRKFSFLSLSVQGVVIQVHVQPRASRNELAGVHETSLKLRLTAPPVEGGANKECIKFLAKLFNLAKSNIEIIQGHKSRHKTLLVKGLTLKKAEDILRQTGKVFDENSGARSLESE